MPSATALLVDSLIKVLAGFAAGFVARDMMHKRGQGTASSGSGGKTAAKPRPTITRPKEELKMVLCVNEALKMGKGKIVGILQKYRGRLEVSFRQWEYHGQAKIALRIRDDVEMDELASQASAAGLPVYIVHDAGRTQIPAGSQTVLAIGPGPKSAIDKVTGHLKLL